MFWPFVIFTSIATLCGAGGGGPPAFQPDLKFNDARNSQYIGQVT